jgi:hypothetical protein
MKQQKLIPIIVLLINMLFSFPSAFAAVYFVSNTGSNSNPGSLEQPFLTVQKAATLMQPGDTCYIRGGVYREWVKPARGGTSEDKRIVYMAYPGETPVIKGSDRITSWVKESGNVWRAEISDNRIGPFNPYYLHVIGAYMKSGYENHLGDVYLNGTLLDEHYSKEAIEDSVYTWYCSHKYDKVSLWANFGENDPNVELTEALIRESVFAPVIPGLGYITIDGLTMQHGASNWAANSRDQTALVSFTAGHHWIVQNCHISDAKCAGIASGYASTTDLQDINSYGNNIVKNNLIERCGQVAIVGMQGWTRGVIEGNLIQDIDYRQRLTGDEMSAIKFHNAMDAVIKNNIIRRVHNGNGIWVDWGNSGVRITGNVIYDIYDWSAIFFEMNHGPLITDNNIFIGKPVNTTSERLIYTHNLSVQSGITSGQESASRASTIWQPHTKTRAAGAMCTATLNDRYYNNIFVEKQVKAVGETYKSDYNVFWQNAKKTPLDANSVVAENFNANFSHTDLPNGVIISFTADDSPSKVKAPFITYDFIGVDTVVKQGLEDCTGKPYSIDTDLFGSLRNTKKITAGPFVNLKKGENRFTITAGPVENR